MMLSTIVLVPILALSVLGTPIINRGAIVKEAHAEQTPVASTEEGAHTGPGPTLWLVETRADEEPHSPRIWTAEKRTDEAGTPDLWLVEKRAPAGAKSDQPKRANYPTPQPWSPDA